jgi:hypothetical protein
MMSAEYNKFSFQIWLMKSQQSIRLSVSDLAEQSVEVRQVGQKVGPHLEEVQ